ncbi:MAG TPA: response regulator [Verrucomicrobiae bacterium]|jgi:CheY-like chemotaxis protein|nr:response regulator [Verrucomicrobiae bacterium]
MFPGKPLAVVEDVESDALLLRLAIEEARIPNRLIFLPDGEQLISYLSGSALFSDRAEFPLPGLLLLDLKMPRLDGFSVLRWIGDRPELRDIPVVVFSASTCEADAAKAIQLGARQYVSKPSQFKVLIELVSALHAKWLTEGDPLIETSAPAQLAAAASLSAAG